MPRTNSTSASSLERSSKACRPRRAARNSGLCSQACRPSASASGPANTIAMWSMCSLPVLASGWVNSSEGSGSQLKAAKRCRRSSFASHAAWSVATKSAGTSGNGEGQKESKKGPGGRRGLERATTRCTPLWCLPHSDPNKRQGKRWNLCLTWFYWCHLMTHSYDQLFVSKKWEFAEFMAFPYWGTFWKTTGSSGTGYFSTTPWGCKHGAVLRMICRSAGVSDWKVLFWFLLLRVFASSESSPPLPRATTYFLLLCQLLVRRLHQLPLEQSLPASTLSPSMQQSAVKPKAHT